MKRATSMFRLLLLLMLTTTELTNVACHGPDLELNPFTYQCKDLTSSAFKPRRVNRKFDVPIFLETIEHDALQQTITRIFAIVLHQVFGFTNVTLMQTTGIEPNAARSEEDRVDEQLQAIVNKKMEMESVKCYVVNLGLHHPAAYPGVRNARNVALVGPLGPSSRFAWFLPRQSAATSNPLPEHLVPMSTFDDSHFNSALAHHFHTNVDDLLSLLKLDDLPSADRFAPDWCQTQRSAAPCAIMLAGHRLDSAFVAEHIRLLGVRVQVLWLGDRLLRSTRTLLQTEDRRMFVLLARTPSEIVPANLSDWRTVVVPQLDGPLSRMQASVYDLAAMVKYANRGDLWQQIERLNFDGQEDGLLGAIAARMMEEASDSSPPAMVGVYEAVACEWLNATNARTRKQLGIDAFNGNATLLVGGIFPGGEPRYAGLQQAAQMAVDAINAVGGLLPETQLSLSFSNESAQQAFMDMSSRRDMFGMISPDAKEITYITKAARMPTIFFTSDGSNDLTENPKAYPFSFQAIGDRHQFVAVYDALFRQFGWHRVALLSDSRPQHVQYSLQLAASLRNSSYEVETVQLVADDDNDEIVAVLGAMRASNFRVFVAELTADVSDRMLCAAHRLGMTAAEHQYVWFLSADQALRSSASEPSKTSYCSEEELRTAYAGHLSLYPAPFARAEEPLVYGNATGWPDVGAWRKEYSRRTTLSVEPNPLLDDRPSYAGFVYDSVWLHALALRSLLLEHRTATSPIFEMGSRDTNEKLRAKLSEVSLTSGLTGGIRFANGRSWRSSDIWVGQRWRGQLDNGSTTDSWRLVFKWLAQPNSAAIDPRRIAGQLQRVLPEDQALWPSLPAGSHLSDGAPLCHLYWLGGFGLGLGCSSTVAIFYTAWAIVAMLAVLGGMYWFWERRFSRRIGREAQLLRSFGIDLVTGKVDEKRLDKSEIARNRLVLNRKIGGGQFGSVFFGQLTHEAVPDGGHRVEQVAIKTPDNPNNYNLRLEFLSEAQAMRRFDHPNIVRLVGVSLLVDPMYIVMEYMLLGDLNMYLVSRRQQVRADTHAEWARRLTGFVLDLARALAYMAELRYVHRDIACRNCLLTVGGRDQQHIVAKLADFGMARPVYGDDVYKFQRLGALPVRWSAPESMQTGIYSPATDVWSFGVLMWEIVTLGGYPYHEIVDDMVLLTLIRSGRTLTIPPEVNEDLRWLISECWPLEPKQRIRAAAIVDFVSSRPEVVEPCRMAADGEAEFAQIYELNNEPGAKAKANKALLAVAAAEKLQANGTSELASVQTLHNDLTAANGGHGGGGGGGHVTNNGNYASADFASGQPTDGGHRPASGAVGRPLLRRAQAGWKRPGGPMAWLRAPAVRWHLWRDRRRVRRPDDRMDIEEHRRTRHVEQGGAGEEEEEEDEEEAKNANL